MCFSKFNFWVVSLMGTVIFYSCDDDGGENINDTPGIVEIRFENIVGNGVNLSLDDVGSTDYKYSNSMEQDFNVTVLKYMVSEIVLEGPNGEYFADELLVTADDVRGYYMINQADVSSMVIHLEDVPAGTYNQLSFKIGVDEDGVEEGAAGGVLSQGAGPLDEDMFWSWNAGYMCLKIEGQSPANETGQAVGESISDTDPYGFAFHIGGWGTPNNNKDVSIDTDNVTVNGAEQPEIHLVMDVLELLSNPTAVDFSLTFNIHSPASGENIANNIPNAVKFDHIHQ